jgi:hypothetical protein
VFHTKGRILMEDTTTLVWMTVWVSHTPTVVVTIELRFCVSSDIGLILFRWFCDQYNAINGCMYIYVSHSLRRVSAGNYGRHRVVLQLGRDLSFTVKIQDHNFVVIPNSGVIKCTSIKSLQ